MSASQVNVQPRLHPIGDPDHLFQVRAIGILKGVIAPDGAITLTGGFQGRDLILGEKVYGLVQELLKQGVDEALFVVWPRTKDGFVISLKVIGVWKPSILNPNSGAQDYLPEGDNYFSIRGKLARRVWTDEYYGKGLGVTVFGEYYVSVDVPSDREAVPLLNPGDFISMDAFLTEDGRLHTDWVSKVSVSEAAFARPRRHSHQVVRRRSSAA